MKSASQKIASIILLLCGFIPLFVMVFFAIKQQVIFHKVNERFQLEQIQTIQIPEAEVNWIEEHEILFNDRMFDIKSSVLSNGVYTFTGVFDDDETDLVKKRDRALGSNKNDHNIFSQLIKWVGIFYDFGEITNSELYTEIEILRSFNNSSPASMVRPVPTPPPQLCSV